jgi:hypothetical protein
MKGSSISYEFEACSFDQGGGVKQFIVGVFILMYKNK